MILLHYLDRIFLPDATEETTIQIPWLDEEGIRVDEQGRITGMIEWTYTSLLPLWKAANYPGVLRGHIRNKAPAREGYGDTDTEYYCPIEYDGARIKFREDADEYIKTKLRPLYVAEVDRHIPGWKTLFESTRILREFVEKIETLAFGLGLQDRLESWLQARTSGTGDPDNDHHWARAREAEPNIWVDSDDSE